MVHRVHGHALRWFDEARAFAAARHAHTPDPTPIPPDKPPPVPTEQPPVDDPPAHQPPAPVHDPPDKPPVH